MWDYKNGCTRRVKNSHTEDSDTFQARACESHVEMVHEEFLSSSPTTHRDTRRRETADFISTTKILAIHHWLKASPPLVRQAGAIRKAQQGAGSSFSHQSCFKCAKSFIVFFFLQGLQDRPHFCLGCWLSEKQRCWCCPSSITTEVPVHASCCTKNKLSRVPFINSFLN